MIARLPPFAKNLLKFLLGAVALWALVRTGSLDPVLVGQAFVNHPAWCALAFVSFACLVLIPAWIRWFLLLRMAGLAPTPWRTFRLHMIGIFFNGLIPGGTGGDLVKGYYLYKDHREGNRALALTSMAMDRLLGLYSLLCVGVAMLALNRGLWRDNAVLKANSVFYGSVFLAFTAAVVLFFSPFARYFLEHPRLHTLPGGRFLKSLSDSLLIYRGRPGGVMAGLMLTFVVDMGLVFIYACFAHALGIGLPFLAHGFVVPTLTMINGIPISPAGLGLGEAAGNYMYNLLGVGEGGEILALVHIAVLGFSLAGMPFYFLFKAKEG